MSFPMNCGDNQQLAPAPRVAVRGRLRHGVTLTELLVVVSIVVLLSSILVPLVQPVLRGQQRSRSRTATQRVSGGGSSESD